MDEPRGTERYVEVSSAEGSVLEELAALALYHPMGYPAFGLHGVAVHGAVCRVFRDGVGEFAFAPLTDNEDAALIYEILARPLDEPGSPEREDALRNYVAAVRGPVVDRQKTMPATVCTVVDGVAPVQASRG